MDLVDQRRKKLRRKLQDILGANSNNIYFQPPESKKLDFPAIVYYLDAVNTVRADDKLYLTYDRYQVTYIHKDLDGETILKILEMPYTEHNRQIKQNDMYQDHFTVYVQ